MKLSELRTNVRRQTETEEAELPNATIDWYLQQAFDRTMALENTWPFFEKSWTLVVPANTSEVAVPTDVNKPSIQSLADATSGVRLMMIDPTAAEAWFGAVDPASTQPNYYTIWGEKLRLFPPMKFATPRNYILRGYRKPVNWIASGPDSSPDCDGRLHAPLIHYAIALAYAQQEDEVLENVYMARWQSDVNRIAAAIMEPRHQQPLVMAGGSITPIGHSPGMPRYTVNTP